MSDWTPGPWVAERVPTSIGHAWRIGRADTPDTTPCDGQKACLYVDHRTGDETRDERTAVAAANARLIAAAPEMADLWRRWLGKVISDDDARREARALLRSIGPDSDA